MSNYTKQINWAGKDSLADSDPNKVISGSDFDTEFTAVQTAVNTKANINGSSAESFSASTAAAGTNTTQVATTAFVTTAVANADEPAQDQATWDAGTSTTESSISPAKLAAAVVAHNPEETASEVLTKIKTVDGAGSGLDADLLDGNEASDFATSGHGHTGLLTAPTSWTTVSFSTPSYFGAPAGSGWYMVHINPPDLGSTNVSYNTAGLENAVGNVIFVYLDSSSWRFYLSSAASTVSYVKVS